MDMETEEERVKKGCNEDMRLEREGEITKTGKVEE